MCTVSYIASGAKRFLTSNRDEHISRPPALPPAEEIINNCKVIYPKDPLAGGSWFAINQNGAAAVLLNGAFTKHARPEKAGISRGLILLNLISHAAPLFQFNRIELNGVEPFTLVLFEHKLLTELRWDGINKFRKDLNPDENFIWSSVTLYDLQTIRKRERLFDQFLLSYPEPDEENVIDFHSNNYNDFENGFIINRKDALKTFSITQVIFEEPDVRMKHFDLINEELYLASVSPRPLMNLAQ